MNYTDEDIEKLIRAIFGGIITPDKLPVKLYLEIAAYLKSGLYDGYGGGLADFGGADLELLKELRTNTYMFSAAKTHAQIIEMSEVLANTKTWKEFKTGAEGIFDIYNKTYLETERITAIGQGASAIKWRTIEKQKNILPLLRYNAVMDANTSAICAPLNGIVAPVGHAIWRRIAPLNHFRCRCILDQLGAGEDVVTKDLNGLADAVTEKMQGAFIMNPGKDGYVFGPDHPYFSVEGGKGRTNFGLPVPKKD